MKQQQQQQSSSTKVQKQVDNTNREIIKCYEHHHSALFKIETLLGISNPNNNHPSNEYQSNQTFPLYDNQQQQNQTNTLPPLLSLNEQEILYYSCKYFVIYNISNKEFQIINKDVKNCTLKAIKKFNTTDTDTKLIVAVYQTIDSQENTFIALLTIKTDYQSRTLRNDSRISWRVLKLFNTAISVQNYTYFAKKNYLYIVTTKSNNDSKYTMRNAYSNESDRCSQYLHIFDLNKEIMLLNQQIRSSTVGFYVQFISLEDYNLVYLCGRNYFRQWTVNFNEKSMKESNVRNIERVLKNKTIVDMQQIERYSMRIQPDHHLQEIPFLNTHLTTDSPLLFQSSKLLIILTHQQVVLIKSNELICAFQPQKNMSKQSKNKDNIEKQLENSFNQIHKMKFLFDEYQEMKDNENYYQTKPNFMNRMDQINQNTPKGVYFTAISKSWKTQNHSHYIAIANSKSTLLIYELSDYHLKLYTEFDCSSPDNTNQILQNIIPLLSGDILLCLNQKNQVILINQDTIESQADQPIKTLWGNGHMHTGLVHAISSPMIQNVMCTVGEDGTFKLWSMRKNERSILFESKSTGLKPLGVTMHPTGTLVCVNFQSQIKLYSILPHQFYEITNIKTNYCPLQIRYSARGEFLVSNEGSVLIFYEPFSLKTLGYIEPADIQFKIIDFRVSQNANYICFLTQENACFLQPVNIGDLSQWQHFTPVHRQSQPYTAFWFDFIEKEKNGLDEKKIRNLFIGATRNKYMVLYENLGSRLVAEFPVIDCYIVDIEVHESLMFVATSKGTVRIYHWPILQQQLQLQVVNAEQNQIRLKPPLYEQYSVWHESIPIIKLHKLNFINQLIIVNDTGNMCVLSFQQTKNKKILYEQVSPQKKKMQQLMNQMFYMKRSEIQKRNKLIEKTENDILKVENEIQREKISLQRKMRDEQSNAVKGYEMKTLMQEEQKLQYLQKEQYQIYLLRNEINEKKNKLSELKQSVTQDYSSKKLYQQNRNNNVNQDIKQIILQHKEKIKKKIDSHKEDIRNKKKQYFLKVKHIQQLFDKEVLEKYQEKLKELDVRNQKSGGEGNRIQTSKSKGKRGDQLIMNILNDNIFSSDTTLQTDNEHVQQLIGKLQTIQYNKKSFTKQTNKPYGQQIKQPNRMSAQNQQLKSSLSTNQQNKNRLSTTEQNKYTSVYLTASHNDKGNTIGSQPVKRKQSQVTNIKQLQVTNIKQPQVTTSKSSQNLFPHTTTQSSNDKKQAKLKRTGIYQINQKSLLRRKQKQQLQQRQKQLQQKILHSHQLMQWQFNDQIIQEMTSKENEDIVIQSFRVDELMRNNLELEKQILGLKIKVTEMQKDDVEMQKEFQAHLQEYNLARFNNLNLHCEVLKMQNQLVERKQILDNKEQIVMLAYQQKQKLQNYKQLVKGSLTKLHEQKQTLRDVFYKKQTDLNSIFAQLVTEIHQMQTKKDTLRKLQRTLKEAEKQYNSKQTQLNQVVAKLKDIKKYLLLEKLNDQKQHIADQTKQKSLYQYEQSLMQTINFLKKRLFMESIKQRKNKQLKKSTVNQVLKQNKNLLQQCNQLRAEGIQYQIEIKNLSDKLKQANKMISIETKLKSQKHDVNQQKNQLEIMKALFKMQLGQFQEAEKQQMQQKDSYTPQNRQSGQDNEGKVYYDIQKQPKTQENNNFIRVKVNNLLTDSVHSQEQQNQQNYNQYKPFKLSKYIEAQPFERI